MSDITEEGGVSTGVTQDGTARRLAKARQWIAHQGLNGYLPSWDELTPDEQEQAETEARHWINAAVNAGISIVPAGRTVADLPEPDRIRPDGASMWQAEFRSITAEVDNAGRPYIRLNGQILLDDKAEAVALAMLAAVATARQQAAQSSGDAGGGVPHE